MKRVKKNINSKCRVFVIISALIFALLVVFWLSISLQRPNDFEKEKMEKDTKEYKDVSGIGTPEELLSYLNQFSVESEINWVSKDFDEFIEDKKGSMADFAAFSAFFLQKNSYEAVILRYNFKKIADDKTGSYAVVVFRDKDTPKYIFHAETGFEMSHHGRSFEDLLLKEEQRKGIRIDDFAIFDAGTLNLNPDSWIKRG